MYILDVNMRLPTPLYNLEEYPNVYDPSEDSFLFLDALECEFEFLKELQPSAAVEIGSGSGIAISALSFILKNTCSYFSTDINAEACEATKNTASLNKVHIDVLNMNLLDSFKDKLFDVILFNPPYVETAEVELDGNGINRSWAGGVNGRVIIDKLMAKLPDLLTDKGVCYMVLLDRNNPLEIINSLKKVNFDGKLVIERKVPGEHLFVYKFFKSEAE